MAQMKEHIKTPEKEVNEMEISNLSDAEFKTLVIRVFKELSEDLSSIKKSVRNKGYTNLSKEQFIGKNSRVDEAENQINGLEHKEAENNQSEQQEERRIQKK